VDYKICGALQERVYCAEDQIQRLRERIVDGWDKLDSIGH